MYPVIYELLGYTVRLCSMNNSVFIRNANIARQINILHVTFLSVFSVFYCRKKLFKLWMIFAMNFQVPLRARYS